MVRRSRRRIPFTFTAAAFTGVVLGHTLTYLAVFPHAASRLTVLAETGHSYWATAEAMALVCALVSAVGTIVRHLGVGRRSERPPSARVLYRSSALRLAALQSGVFLAQETLERLRVGAPLSGLLHDGFMPVGILMQILVAAVLAVILTVLGFTAEAVGRALSQPRVKRRATQSFPRPRQVFACGELATGRYRTRAPPSLLPLTV